MGRWWPGIGEPPRVARWWRAIRDAAQARSQARRARAVLSEPARLVDEAGGYVLARAIPAKLLLIAALILVADLYLWPVGAVLAGAALAHLLPGTTRAVLLRLGLVRTAAWHAAADGWNWGRDRSGGRLVTLALAHLRYRDPEIERLLDAQLTVVGKVGAGAVLAAAIRALTRGDRPEARRLLRLVAEFDGSVRPPAAARLAIDLLAAEAADSGEIERMLRELDRPRSPRTALGNLLRSCVRARRGEGSSGPLSVLRRDWLLAGAWRRTAPLVERVRRPLSPAPAPAPEPTDQGPVLSALLATARLGVGPRAPSRAEVSAAAERWDRVFDSPAELARLRARGSSRSDPVPALREQVLESLAERLEASAEPAEPGEEGGPLFREAAFRCADRRHQALEWLAEEIGHRTDARRPLPLMDEVRAWCRLIEAYERVVAMSPDRASASFPRLYYPVVRHTVWLHNDRGQSALANAMYRVELRLAEQVSHDSGVALLTRNLGCGP